MRYLIVWALPLMALVAHPRFSTRPAAFSDTNHTHVPDGKPDDWKMDSVHEDPATHIASSFDNDENDLYVLLNIRDRFTQMKMIRMGMRLFIDLKAKKKENMGIEFPVKRDLSASMRTGGREGNAEGDGERERPDPKEIRERMAAQFMYSMKIFGFQDMDEPREIGLSMFNTCHIAFAWNEEDMLTIEYKIPLSMIDEVRALKGKEISLGIKIFGVETSGSGAPISSGMSGGAGGRGGSGGGRRPGMGGTGGGTGSGGGSGTDRQMQMEEMRKEQQVWTHYIIH